MIGFQGLMMEPEGRRWYSIIKQRSLAMFGLVHILVECTLTMIGFQGLITELEVWKLHQQILEINRGQNIFQGNSNKSKYVANRFRNRNRFLLLRNKAPGGVARVLPVSWEGIGYSMEEDRDDGRGREGVGHRNSLSPGEMQQQKLLLHVDIL
ncbi:hypothetical protein EVAR_86221_1 [Eumeta japonica]|uniref:Uncharacterized protein n=1 Tax=Eumeta variegata TaxID=151549 RepID=A0A4C1UD52_EUMVA|nr:hypothetical protein EVAR_86221_1 [Eumeta japonica]